MASMAVKVQVDLTRDADGSHLSLMRFAAQDLTNDSESIRVCAVIDVPGSMIAEFTMLKCREIDVVDRIGKRFRTFMHDYSDITIWFPK